VEARHFTIREALDILGIKPPKVTKSMSQADIDLRVQEWKESELTEHYKKARKEAHPDRHGGTEESTQRFKDLHNAYEEVKAHLQLRKPKVPPAKVTECRDCGMTRVPNDAIHCWNCGRRYTLDKPRTECPACEADRNPSRAKFCPRCGYDYQVADVLAERLVAKGFTRDEIEGLRTNGTLDRWREVFNVAPFHPDLEKAMNDELHMATLRRGLSGRLRGLI